MADKTFRVQIFQVDIPDDAPPNQISFENAILRAGSLPLDERERHIDPKDRRLEDINEAGGIFLLNFTTFNYPGPGRVKSGVQSSSFSLAADEFFAFETALLYDSQRRTMFLETGLGGMGAGATAKYFAGFAGKGAAYDMTPLLDPEASARARRCRQFRKVDMRVVVGPANDSDRDGGLGVIAAFGDDFDARVVDVSMNVGPDRTGSLLPERVRDLVDRVVGHDDCDITKLRVRGRENDDDPFEVIDLLQHREKRERTLLVDPNSRKIPVGDRWSALRDIHRDYYANVP